MEYAGAGEHDPEPVALRSWMVETLATPSAHRALALAVEYGVDIYERAAPLWPAVNAVAMADPAVEKYWGGVTVGRRAGMSQLVAHIAELDSLSEGLDITTATDIMFVLNGHGTFQGLVVESDWDIHTFKAWLYSTLVQQLLVPGDPDPSATEDRSFAHLVDR